MVRRYKYGRRAPVITRRTMRSALLMASTLDALGTPPPESNDYVSKVEVPWGMMANDRFGCCTAADTGHTLMLRTANASGSIVVPTDDQVLALYSAVTNPPFNASDPLTDNGAQESDVCAYLVSNGFLGHKAQATGNIEPSNLDHLRWAIQLSGFCRIGLNLPGFAEDQFDAGARWDVSVTGDQSTAGHDVPLVDYRNGTFTCVSWGRLQGITPAFLDAYCEEAHWELYPDWITAQGEAPPGFDLTDLASKLKAITTS
jgi:hypothetical protein